MVQPENELPELHTQLGLLDTADAKKAFIESECQVDFWGPQDNPLLIYQWLEQPNWAPWLAAGPETIAGRGAVFPQGQLLLKDRIWGKAYASLSLNRIFWDGNPAQLPNWDTVAGDPTDYSTTYQPQGNTLVLMSMNIRPDYQGLQLPAKMIDHTLATAHALGIEHVIGSFRPSGYGAAKKEAGYQLDFAEYCATVKPGSDKPVDPWLRSLAWKGMRMMAVDHQAMVVPVPIGIWKGYMGFYKPGEWVETAENVWECGEVGKWTVDPQNGVATYQESNVWGILPYAK